MATRRQATRGFSLTLCGGLLASSMHARSFQSSQPIYCGSQRRDFTEQRPVGASVDYDGYVQPPSRQKQLTAALGVTGGGNGQPHVPANR